VFILFFTLGVMQGLISGVVHFHGDFGLEVENYHVSYPKQTHFLEILHLTQKCTYLNNEPKLLIQM
jgi:hypothetical protein